MSTFAVIFLYAFLLLAPVISVGFVRSLVKAIRNAVAGEKDDGPPALAAFCLTLIIWGFCLMLMMR